MQYSAPPAHLALGVKHQLPSSAVISGIILVLCLDLEPPEQHTAHSTQHMETIKARLIHDDPPSGKHLPLARFHWTHP